MLYTSYTGHTFMLQNSPWICNVSELPIMFVSTFILPAIKQYKELWRLQMTRLWNKQQRIQNSISLQGQETFSSITSKPAPRPMQPPIHCVLGTLSLELKQQQGSKATQSTLPSLNVNNVYSYSSSPPLAIMACTWTSPLYAHLHAPHNYQLDHN